jgi:hypothetical protein
MKWAIETNREELPTPAYLEKYILNRSMSFILPTAVDLDPVVRQQRIEKHRTVCEFFDFYTDRMIPTVAGARLFHSGVRHFEPMTTSVIPNSGADLRITSSTEAFTALLYKNGWKKWNAMLKFDRENPKTGAVPKKKTKRYPVFKPKKPDENKEWMTPYTDSQCGKKPLGGWNKEGRLEYLRLKRIVLNSRKNNGKRHVKEDEECVARLHEKHKELYEALDEPKPDKKRKADEISKELEEEDELGWCTD